MSGPRPDNLSLSANANAFLASHDLMAGTAEAAAGASAEHAAGAPGPAAAARDARSAWIRRLMADDGPGILRMLWRILGREQDVMDAYQDCFCKLASLAPDREPRNARAYAYRTASNIAIELIRVRQRRAAHWDRVVRQHEQRNEQEPQQGADSGDQDRLREAIAQLPAHLRSVVVLRDLSRLPYEQVGRTLGIDPATARVYRRHAVVKLAELLGAKE